MNSKGNILLVDDSEALLKLISSFLEAENYTLFTHGNGEKALEFLENNTPDLILLDRTMPGMQGIEVCKHIKQNKKLHNIPIIFLTATSDVKSIVEGFQAGAVDYITKPFQKEELIARVHSHIELYQITQILNEQTKVLTENEKSLKQINATKDKFFSIIAHDLKNPLNNILQLSNLLKENYSSASHSESNLDEIIAHLTATAENTTELLANLLDWAQFQVGHIKYSPQKLLFTSINKQCFDLLSSTAYAKGITLESSIHDSIHVFADENMTLTLLRNLISNAIKFTPKKGTVKVSAIRKDKIIKICVSDTGVGIAEERLDTIFLVTKSKSTYGTDGEHGTGLGLILCKEFVNRHQGDIWVESELGKGSQFYFTLPSA
ncbi:MAG: hybrid sensor histidine kinase/response regulator [Bacteroidales bacterium]|jgi:signal transduction histidine kinase|nr:hybrid sensor histidine kinase/response regulator [Bacteroidales bacterium]MDD4383743.1 hybrid sensor histidine kinase/response regulator [Bacteroidales bacterium]MDY0196275.1 hybrid sensor histidine kinase/response regulator [Tenuifilaceae bacterium]